MTRDNGCVPYVPAGFVSQAQITNAVEQAIHKLGPEVVRVRHRVGTDTGGDPALFFRIVLADWAVNDQTLADVTGKIVDTIFDSLRPHENWGLIPYFSFRSNAEQTLRSDPEWT